MQNDSASHKNPVTVRADVAVIGAGPVGLFTVFECGMAGMRCRVIDALPETGGQCTALYPEKPIYDIPGFPCISAAALIDNLEVQAAPFAPVYHLGHKALSLSGSAEAGFILRTDAGLSVECRAVIIAAGAGAFGVNRPPLKNLALYEGKSVFYHVRRREDFRDKTVVIAGGGDSAVDWAVSLASVAAKITVVHRRDTFRAANASVARMKRLAAEGRIDLKIPYQLAGIDGSPDGPDIILRHEDGTFETVTADRLLPFFGLAPETGFLKECGFDLQHNHVPVTPADCMTARPGIFAVGDVAAYPGKLKLILTGFAEAAIAARVAHNIVFDGKPYHFEHSTSKGTVFQKETT
jgi:thioredoxin reductase (NADPH)